MNLSERSGKFVLRISPQLHAQLTRLAQERGESLNSVCVNLIERAISQETLSPEKPSSLIEEIQREFQTSLQGIVLFGSQARGDATEGSDMDLLIVLERGTPISRKLYGIWDKKIEPLITGGRRISPQFVALLDSAEKAGGIWLETAMEGIVLWEPVDRPVSKILYALRRDIVQGMWQRMMAHGCPYWVRTHQTRRVV